MIGTRIFKIDSEIDKILEVKVSTFSIGIIFLPLTGANFDLNYLSYFYIDFQNSCAYHVANFLKF